MRVPPVKQFLFLCGSIWPSAVLLIPALAQLPAENTGTRFDVASVHAPDDTSVSSSSSVLPGGRYIAVNVTLRDLVRSGYDVRDAELFGGAIWTRRMRFDVQARASGEWTVEGFRRAVRPMLRELLADRFGLKVHREERVLAVYALQRTGRDGHLGPRLRRATSNCTSASPCATGFNRRGAMTGQGLPLSVLVESLGKWSDRPVLDRTTLSGLFDRDLTWDPDTTTAATPNSGNGVSLPGSFDGVSLFTAVREQLGLTLKPTRDEVPVIVIDDAAVPVSD